MPVKIIIIEDQIPIREGLGFLIDRTDGFACIGKYRSMESVLAGLPDDIPDAALVDIGLPGMSGIEGIPRLLERYPRMAILMLTVYDDDERIFQALCAGANGYLLKKTPPARLLDYIQEAIQGGAPMSPEIARRVLHLFRQNPPAPKSHHALTPHELRLLKMLVDGHSCGSAAEELGVSFHAVTYHMRNIYEKLHVHSKTEAVIKALKLRLV